MKKVREYATLYPHSNNSETKPDEVHCQLYNGLYNSKSDFLDHNVEHGSVDCNDKMICSW